MAPSPMSKPSIAEMILSKRNPSGSDSGSDPGSDGSEMPPESPDVEDSMDSSQPDDDQGLTMAAHDLVTAVHGGDIPGVASALQAAFQILDSQSPQDEGQPQEEPSPDEDQGEQQ